MSVTKRPSDDYGYYHDEWDVAIIPSGPGAFWIDFGSGGQQVNGEAFDALRECFRAYESDHPEDARGDEVSEMLPS